GSMVADHLPNALGGLPDGTPQRPTSSMPYPAVHDMPPPRATTVLTAEETKKLESDLVAARNRAAEAAAKSAADAAKPGYKARAGRSQAGIKGARRPAGAASARRPMESRGDGRILPHSASAALRLRAGQSREGRGPQCRC